MTSDPTDAIDTGPFLVEGLVEAFADAAEALHRPGPVRPKAQWAVETIRRVAGARLVAYVDLGKARSRVRAASGASLAEARQVIGGPAEDLVEEARDSGKPAQLDVEIDGTPTTVVAIPVAGTDGEGVRAVIVAVPPPEDSADPVGWITEAIALHLGVAFDTSQTVLRLSQLEAAREEIVQRLQDAVRAPAPHVEGAELGVHYQPADPGAPIGGDLYDWYVLPDGDLHIAVVDVTGKGVTATKDALAVTHALRVLVLEEVPMERLIERADAVFSQAHEEMMATLVLARYSPDTGRVRIVSGGHPPPLVISSSKGAEFLESRGVPIGWPRAGSTNLIEHTLEVNDTLVLYTDGVIEATGDVIRGLDDLAAAAREVARYPASYLARGLVDRALSGASRRDDSVVLALRHRVLDHPAQPMLGPFVYRFSPSTATVPLVRHFFHDWLRHQPVDPDLHEDLLFVATELCGNSVRAASGAPGSIQLRAEIDRGAVVIEIEDDGEGYQLDPENTPPQPDAEAGRGLFLVRALTDEVTVERRDDHTFTRCVMASAILPDRAEGGEDGEDGED